MVDACDALRGHETALSPFQASTRTSVTLSCTITGMQPTTTALPTRMPHPPPWPLGARQNRDDVMRRWYSTGVILSPDTEYPGRCACASATIRRTLCGRLSSCEMIPEKKKVSGLTSSHGAVTAVRVSPVSLCTSSPEARRDGKGFPFCVP